MTSISDLERAHSVVGAGLNSLISIAYATGGAVGMGMILMGLAIKENYGELYSEANIDDNSDAGRRGSGSISDSADEGDW